MADFRQQLEEAVAELDQHFWEIKAAARNRLGELFDESDYPSSLIGAFEISHDFPSVEPPEYLRRLNPELYQQEVQRVQSRFTEAVQLAEEAFIEELSGLVSHLRERLNGEEDGTPKVFRDSAVKNLQFFFERFQMLNVSSNDQLDELVQQCQRAVSGVVPQSLRDSSRLRGEIGKQLGIVQSALDELLVERPRRRIVRSVKTSGTE